jgi:60 kDa SS-A/Ro ribonucleoprotein
MKFRNQSVGTKTQNLAGGEAFKESPELELVSLLLTSFVEDKFYESAKTQLKRLQTLIDINDKKFVAQAAIYARTEFGMRSITHALFGELLTKVKGQPWLKKAISKGIYRPDDLLEITAYYLGKFENGKYPNGKKVGLPAALRKGAKYALSKFSEYQLAKYRGDRSNVKMVDVVNLIHKKPTEKESPVYEKLMKGDLKSTETWESKLSKSGQEVKDILDETEKEEKLKELKAENWKDLIENKKLGYFALLRNLRNIMTQAPEILNKALEQLIDQEAIKKSLVFPFRFKTAMDEIEKVNGSREVVKALSEALEKSLVNVPKFDGKTLVVIDESGSMSGKPIQIGSIFAAVLYSVNDSDLMAFAEDARYLNYNPVDSVSTIADRLIQNANGGGTNFHSIFKKANVKYDRIIILSDMQGWMGYLAPTKKLNEYKQRTGANPFIYSFDLAGYGQLEFPEKNIFCIAGFSDKIFSVMKMLETDKTALINKIKAITF